MTQMMITRMDFAEVYPQIPQITQILATQLVVDPAARRSRAKRSASGTEMKASWRREAFISVPLALRLPAASRPAPGRSAD